MKKKIIVLISIGVIFLALIGIILYNEIPRLSYEYDEDLGGYVVSKSYGYAKTYEILETYKGEDVVGIKREAFKNRTSLVSIDLSNTKITNIGIAAFSGCVSLEEIIFNTDIYYINNNAFLGCTSLTSIDLEDTNLTILGGSVFFDCTSLESVSLPSTLDEIGSYCFYNTNLTYFSYYSSTTLRSNALEGIDSSVIVVK